MVLVTCWQKCDVNVYLEVTEATISKEKWSTVTLSCSML